MGLPVDAARLAPLIASAACDALALVDYRSEQGEAGYQAECRPDGTDRVAVCASALPCKEGDYREGDGGGNCERRSDPVRSEQSCGRMDHPAVGTVGGYQREQELKRGKRAHESECEHRIAHGLVLFFVTVYLGGGGFHGRGFQAFVFHCLELCRPAPVGDASVAAPEEDDKVLVYAQRAYHRAVQPSEDEGQQQDERDCSEVQGQAGRQELQAGHPTPPF